MVAPIVGPIWKTNHVPGLGPGTRYDERLCYTQTPPHTVPMPYQLRLAEAIDGRTQGPAHTFPNDMSAVNDTGGKGCCCSGSPPPRFAPLTEQAVNIARAKFMSTLHEQALVGVNLAERQQAMTMVNNRCRQAVGLFRELYGFARGNPNSLASVTQLVRQITSLNSTAVKRRAKEAIQHWRQGSKSMANLWLEFHFGWEPLVSDVYAAFELFDKPVPTVSTRANSRRVDGSYVVGYHWSDDEYFKANYIGSARATVFGSFEVSNLDLYRAQRLGLTNPLTIGWELVPFSFVLDWFTTVGEYLAQFDGTLGLTLKDVGYSTRLKTQCEAVRAFYSGGWNTAWLNSRGVYFDRYLGLPDVKLGLRPPTRLSLTRAATAISLLVGLLGKRSIQRPLDSPKGYVMSVQERRATYEIWPNVIT